jgi:Protein of unknown function (DUF2897)
VKSILIVVLVIAVIAGGLLALRSGRQLGMPSDEVLKRAAKRAREQADEEND